MTRGTRLVAGLAIVVSACAPRVRQVAPPSIAERLGAVDALVRAGCYDCLVDALAGARQIETTSPQPATHALVREVLGLLAIRERSLGLADQHYLDQVRDAFEGREDRFLVDVIATLPRRYAGAGRAADEDWIESLKIVARNRETWRTQLSALDGADALASAAAISFECAHNANRTGPELGPLLDRSGAWKDTPLLRFTAALCISFEPAPLAELLDADPRFVEIDYFLGVAATLKGNLEEADRQFNAAFAWRQDWPAATIAVANLAMTAEDFDRAVDFYDRTVALVPGSPDAMLGRVRALTFAGKYAAAIAGADDLLAARRWYVGDALYWRALNEAQLDRVDAAWADVREAARTIVNADVPKLTGILAVRRGDLTTARAEFATAHERNANDCETAVLLGGTELELREWTGATPILRDAVRCLDAHEADLTAEIARLRAAGGRERIVAHREQSIATDRQQRAQAFFNLAVAAFNVGDRDNARAYAERVATDDHFGERARHLLDRLRP